MKYFLKYKGEYRGKSKDKDAIAYTTMQGYTIKADGWTEVPPTLCRTAMEMTIKAEVQVGASKWATRIVPMFEYREEEGTGIPDPPVIEPMKEIPTLQCLPGCQFTQEGVDSHGGSMSVVGSEWNRCSIDHQKHDCYKPCPFFVYRMQGEDD